MVQARKNPDNGRYVLYVGDSRGLAYYVAGVRGTVDLYAMPVANFQRKFSSVHQELTRQVVEQFRTELPEGWVITHKAGEQLNWITGILRKNSASKGETTMSESKSQPKLSAAKKPSAAPVAKPKAEAAAKPEPKSKASKPAADEGEGTSRKNPYAGMKITVLSKDIAAREGSVRHTVLSAIIKAKKVDDIYGTELEVGDSVAKVNTAWLNFAKTAGLVDFVA